MYISSFNVILRNDEKKVTISSNTTTFSENLSILNKYVSDLGGIPVSSNTVRFTSEEAFNEFVSKLLEF